MEKFNIENYYQIYKDRKLFDDNFFDFSIKQYEAEKLVDILKIRAPKKILIIGAFKGFSTLIMLKENPSADMKIWCIDPFFKDYYAGDDYGFVYNKIIKEFDSENKVETVKGYATLAGEEVFNLSSDRKGYYDPSHWFKIDAINNSFDLIFIDGDHKFETALVDFIKSWDKLNDGGTIIIHDTVDKLWKEELNKLLVYIGNVSGAKLIHHDQGINGLVVVEKKYE